MSRNEDLQTVLLAAAKHEAFEECFSLPSFARTERLVEIACDYTGDELFARDLLAGGALDERSEAFPDGWSAKFFEAIYTRHQLPWNGGPTREGDPRQDDRR